MPRPSILDRTRYRQFDELEKIEYLEGLVRDIEECLRANRQGGFSAADVTAALWTLGLDPG